MRTFKDQLEVFDANELDLTRVEIAIVVKNYICVYKFLSNEEIYEIICSFIYKYKMDTITEIDTNDIIEGLCNALGNNEITMDDIETNYEKVIDVISYYL